MRFLTAASIALTLFAISLAESRHRPLWYDEIFTSVISRSGGPGAIWSALASGTDLNPPLYYLAVRGADALLGPTPLSLRLPSALGYLLMTACLYRFASRRYPPGVALVAMTLPAVTEAFAYSYQGRAYGMVLGFSALALVCWQSATEATSRVLPLVGLAASLAAAMASHYYAVVAVIPLAVAEAMRTRSSRRVDLAIWAALAIGVASLLAYLPLMAAARQYGPVFWAKPSLGEIPRFYAFLLEDSAPSLVLLLLVTSVAGRGPSAPDPGEGFRPEERWASLAFAAFPALAVATATLGKLGYTPRYSLPAVIGLGLLVASVAGRRARGRTAVACVLSLLLGCGYSHLGALKSARGGALAPTPWADLDLARANRDGLPVAIPDALLYLEWAEGRGEDRAFPAYFVSKGADTETLALTALAKLKPLKVMDREAFLGAYDRFLVCDSRPGGLGGWLVGRLLDEGATVRVRAQTEKLILFEVEIPRRKG